MRQRRGGLLPLLAASAALLRAAAQQPGVQHGGGACASDWDCSLGGTCAGSRTCECDAWWTGPSCALLNLQPVDSLESTGLQVPGYFSWGGHTLRDDAGAYHLFASMMCDHATLGSWTTKSSMAHAVSTAGPTGPFFLPAGDDPQLVVPPWSHGAYIVRDPPTGKFLLWHLGDGTVDPTTWRPCFNSSSVEIAGRGAEPAAASGAAAGALPRQAQPGQRQAFVEVADSLDGPWTSFNNNTGVFVTFPAGGWASAIDNPSPYIFDNGTTLLFFRDETCPPGWGALAPACIGVARADTWQGPYESLFKVPITHPEGEDPAVFRDPRGNYHMLTNVNTYHNRCAQGVPCGGHAWSYDALTWSNQSIGAFGPIIRFTNGSYFFGAYAERPQVYQAPDRTPIAFYMGFGRSSYMDSVNWAQLFCTAELNATRDCGPQTAPPPPPPVALAVAQGGACLVANASAYPCAGGWGDSCPLLLGSCADATAAWTRLALPGGGETLAGLAPNYAGRSFLNIDCNACAAGTRAKVTTRADYANAVALDAASGTLRVAACAGMCLSGTTAEPRAAPCKDGEWAPPAQLALVDCADAAAGGWTETVR